MDYVVALPNDSVSVGRNGVIPEGLKVTKIPEPITTTAQIQPRQLTIANRN